MSCNPAYQHVWGEKCYPLLTYIAERIAVVDCIRNSEVIPALAEDVIRIGAKCLWMQLGVINFEAAAQLLRVWNRCVKIEQERLLGGLNFVNVNTNIVFAKRPDVLSNFVLWRGSASGKTLAFGTHSPLVKPGRHSSHSPAKIRHAA
ncbi:MAG: CoA-binding protein [Betaproteobacteria bacterium]